MPITPVVGVGRASAITITPATAITALATAGQIANLFRGPKWGIFNRYMVPLLVSDSVRAMDYRRGWTVPTYPIEAGGFASYNKVQMPIDTRVSFSNGGQKEIDGAGGIFTTLIPGLGLANLVASLFGAGTLQGMRRQAFLKELTRIAESLEPVNVVTPEVTIGNLTIVDIEYRRDPQDGGTSLIPVEVALQEIRPTGVVTLTQTASPAGAATQAQGQVQATAPTVTQAQRAFTGPLDGGGV